MKKLTTLVLAAGLVVSSFAGASAGEFKPNAQFINQFADAGSALAKSPTGFGVDENFKASTRLRLGFDYIASENLSGTFLFQVGPFDYGDSGSELDSAVSDNSMKVRLAYVDWIVPTTDVQVRMGFQPVSLPAFAFGSAVLDSRGAGITVSAPINENIALSTFWIRAESDDNNTGAAAAAGAGHDDADIFAIVGDFTYDGFRVAPWAAYMSVGSQTDAHNSGFGLYPSVGAAAGDVTAWYLGTSFELSMFDPFMFTLDAYYSDASWDAPAAQADDMNGFFVGAAAAYKTQWGTPALKAWYASGNDKGNDLGQPLGIVSCFAATSIMFDDQVMDNGVASPRSANPAGTWGVVLEWADMSFIEKLSHTARIAYMEGTNEDTNTGMRTSNALAYLEDDDNVIEFNFNSTYEIYKNFSAHLELGWLTADFGDARNVHDADDDIFRSALAFVYTF